MKVKSYLPVFPGFYSTIFEADEEPYIDEGRSWADYEWDYSGYNERVAKACCNWVEKELSDFGIKVSFEAVISPHEYNFRNDSINVEYTVKALKPIKNYLQDNKEAFEAYLKEHYTGRSGFIPFHSNSFEDWFSDITDEHKFGSVLNFILFNEDEAAEVNMYHSIAGEAFVDGELIETADLS